MNLELDHFFILTDNPKEAGDMLVALGISESFSRDHKGQGTSNRRFQFSNGMLEILYLRDMDEANNGPAKNMHFANRVAMDHASPFGVILARKDNKDLAMPFAGWRYQPDYFKPPMAFHVGVNSEILEEPLCIYVPFLDPISRKDVEREEEEGSFNVISKVHISVPRENLSPTLRALSATDRLQVEVGSEHLVSLTLDNHKQGLSKDFRPQLPLVIYW